MLADSQEGRVAEVALRASCAAIAEEPILPELRDSSG